MRERGRREGVKGCVRWRICRYHGVLSTSFRSSFISLHEFWYTTGEETRSSYHHLAIRLSPSSLNHVTSAPSHTFPAHLFVHTQEVVSMSGFEC